MDSQLIILAFTVLLTIIGFLLAGIYSEMKKMGNNVESLMVREAAQQQRINDLERRINILENPKPISHAKG